MLAACGRWRELFELLAPSRALALLINEPTLHIPLHNPNPPHNPPHNPIECVCTTAHHEGAHTTAHHEGARDFDPLAQLPPPAAPLPNSVWARLLDSAGADGGGAECDKGQMLLRQGVVGGQQIRVR